MRVYKTHYPRILLLGWLAFILLWPVQGARALTIDHGAMVICPFMPGMIMGASVGVGKPSHHHLCMSTCRHIQCQHQLGVKAHHGMRHIHLYRIAGRFTLFQHFVTFSQHPTQIQAPRAPPPYQRFDRLLI